MVFNDKLQRNSRVNSQEKKPKKLPKKLSTSQFIYMKLLALWKLMKLKVTANL